MEKENTKKFKISLIFLRHNLVYEFSIQDHNEYLHSILIHCEVLDKVI
jgi:hypothetical protein